MTETASVEHTQAEVAEELRQLGSELRSVMSDEHDVVDRVRAAVSRADQAGISRLNVTGLMGILDDSEALKKARSILRGMQQPRPDS